MLWAVVLILLLNLVEAKTALRIATLIGKSTNSGTIEQFLGIKFASAKRYELPILKTSYSGHIKADALGPACIQQPQGVPIGNRTITRRFFGNQTKEEAQEAYEKSVGPQSEDCLNLKVVRPAGIRHSDKLPVVLWIYGGGFEIGTPETGTDASALVNKSVILKKPVIFVGINYRLSGYGFLGGKELVKAGVANIGLHDQRAGMKWVQKNIAAFGGDPEKVTIFGLSAGSISVSLHLLVNDGNHEGLFRAAFMQSGSPVTVASPETLQLYYDDIVARTNCSKHADTLGCLKTVPLPALRSVMNDMPDLFSYEALAFAFEPIVDGKLFSKPFYQMVREGLVANVPIVSGDADDEGTIFSFSSTNVTTDSQALQYFKNIYLPKISDEDLVKLGQLYPSSPDAGSPFNTGSNNTLTSQWKRIAAFQGDVVFQAPRRHFLQYSSDKQSTWSFVYRRGKNTPYVGSSHGSDASSMFGVGKNGTELQDALIHFANDLDPNTPSLPKWPRYTSAQPNMLAFVDGKLNAVIINDTYRKDAIAFLNEYIYKNPN